jgi:catechol 2,3-dioxygenase-like lactoylglutathione lyase family enzyme
MIGAGRVFHINVNCSDLDRSLAFYRDTLGLETRARTTPQPQPCGPLGLDQAQWDAWILTDRRGWVATAVDLLEWKLPAPEGPAPLSVTQLGFNRLCFTTTDPGRPDGLIRDPDGTALQFEAGDGDRFERIVINCSQLERSVAFYRDVVGLAVTSPPERWTGSGERYGLGDSAVTFDSVRLAYPGDLTTIELVQWLDPAPTGRPPARANQLGLYRMALLTHDIEADWRTLEAAGVTCPKPGALDMGPGLPSVTCTVFRDPDGTTLEPLQQPR